MSFTIAPSTCVDPFAGLHPIFRACVDPGNSRYSVGVPWIEETWIYATDGRIIVRCPVASIGPEAVEAIRSARAALGRPPKGGAIFEGGSTGFATEPARFPAPAAKKLEFCLSCDGYGQSRAVALDDEFSSADPCEACDSAGWVEVWPDTEILPGWAIRSGQLAALIESSAALYLPDPIGESACRFTVGESTEGRLMLKKVE